MQTPVLVNRGWVPRGWRDKNIKDSENLEKALESKAADITPNGEGAWWRFWSKKPTVSKVIIDYLLFTFHLVGFLFLFFSLY